MGGRKNLIQFFLTKESDFDSHTIKFCAHRVKSWKNVKLTHVRRVRMSRPRFVQFSMPDTRKKRKHDDKTKGGFIQNFLHLSRCTVWKDVTLVPTLTRGFCWPLPYWSWRTCSALKLLHDLLSNSSLCMLHGYILTLTLTQCSRELAICKKTEKKENEMIRTFIDLLFGSK